MPAAPSAHAISIPPRRPPPCRHVPSILTDAVSPLQHGALVGNASCAGAPSGLGALRQWRRHDLSRRPRFDPALRRDGNLRQVLTLRPVGRGSRERRMDPKSRATSRGRKRSTPTWAARRRSPRSSTIVRAEAERAKVALLTPVPGPRPANRLRDRSKWPSNWPADAPVKALRIGRSSRLLPGRKVGRIRRRR